jgi:uncharacterized membrane protein YdjX (TVP38/TMEM64 family)
MRLITIAVALAALLTLPFLFWGEEFARGFSGESAIEWIRGWGAWGAFAVIALLMSDLVLPIPATPVISAAGYLYGAWVGGLIGATGSFASGMLGYGLCRAFGHSIAHRLAGGEALAQNEALFRRSGPWLVAASRWLPLLPEVIACLAGITAMPLRIFAAALACGAVPLGFVYAAIGASGHHNPQLAMALSLLIPPLLWLITRHFLR